MSFFIMSSLSRGVAAGASVSGGGGGGELPLLTLNSANDENPAYKYWDFMGSYVGSYKHPLPLPPEGFPDRLQYHYTQGRMGRGTAANRLFVMGPHQGQSFCEIIVPELVANTSDHTTLNRATYAQSIFSRVRTNAPVDAPTGGTDWGDGGAHPAGWWVDPVSGRLAVNCTAYYGGSVQFNTVVYEDAAALSDAAGQKRGFFQVRRTSDNMQGGRVCSGWFSDIPVEFQGADKLNGTVITGNSDGYSTRFNNASIGPSAWIVDPTLITRSSPITNGGVWPGVPALSYPHGDPDKQLVSDAEADSGHPMWTTISYCVFAAIIPGTRTYLCVGGTGGNVSGISYGVPPYGGDSGFYPIDPTDVGAFYWLFNVDDMIDCVQGNRDPWDSIPYEFGYLDVPWQGIKTAEGGQWHTPTGAVYVPETNQMHISCYAAEPVHGLDIVSVFDLPD